MKINRANLTLIIFIALSLAGCLKDNVTSLQFNLQNNALMLNYFEGQGDYINSDNMPSIVTAGEIHNNLNNYLIIDVRSQADYINGHIPGAINVQNDSLIVFLNSKNNLSEFPKIVLVSKTGQAASYYTALLRLYGISNIYSLNFGIAQWNNFFSDAWQNNVQNSPMLRYFEAGYTSIPDSINPLPEIDFTGMKGSISDKIKTRISDILQKGYKNDVNYVTFDTTNILQFNGEDISNFYIICYGKQVLYYLYQTISHIPDSWSFINGKDLKSTEHLQNIPADKKVVIYSVSGQTSSYIAAYLRVLGYDAKSLRYGACGLFYTTLASKSDVFTPYVWLNYNIKNYNYVTGSNPN